MASNIDISYKTKTFSKYTKARSDYYQNPMGKKWDVERKKFASIAKLYEAYGELLGEVTEEYIKETSDSIENMDRAEELCAHDILLYMIKIIAEQHTNDSDFPIEDFNLFAGFKNKDRDRIQITITKDGSDVRALTK